jgi:hypothetical protein
MGKVQQDLHNQLWQHILNRLQTGEVIITADQFLRAIDAEYLNLTGETASAAQLDRFRKIIEDYNQIHPETYVSRGVQNGVDRAFQSNVEKLAWNATKVEEPDRAALTTLPAATALPTSSSRCGFHPKKSTNKAVSAPPFVISLPPNVCLPPRHQPASR